MNLEDARKAMAQRDLFLLQNAMERRESLTRLADLVPDLVAEVERLKDQGKTACELFDHLKESQKEVRSLELQLGIAKKALALVMTTMDCNQAVPGSTVRAVQDALRGEE